MKKFNLFKRKSKWKFNFFKKKSKFSIKGLLKKIKSKFSNDDNVENDLFNTREVLLVILVSVCFGVAVGAGIFSNSNLSASEKDDINEIVSTYEDIVESYYGELEEDELVEAAIEGMVSVLNDPYSSYMDSDTTESFNQTIDGSFVGIGVTVEWSNEQFRIIEVLNDSPAQKVGLQVDDYIVEVDNIVTDGLTLDDLSFYIKGDKNTKVIVKVKRGEEYFEYEMKRSVVEIQSVHGKEYGEVGYIAIDTFASNTASQFKKELKKLEKNGIKSLIIDVRGNSGGKLSQVDEILELFFKKKTVLYQIENNNGVKKVYSSKKNSKNYSVVILTNSCSASASEILASAFQSNYENSMVVGTNTYGKGTIQKAVKLSNGASIKYTTQKWLTAEGTWINDVGVTPDVYVEQSELYYQTPSHENDMQLQKAIELLNNKEI